MVFPDVEAVAELAVARDARTRELLTDATSCSMCRRQIINAGIAKVIIRTGKDKFKIVDVEEWVKNDDSLFWTE